MVLKTDSQILLKFTGLIIFLLFWYLVCFVSQNKFIPSPLEVFIAFREEFRNGQLVSNLRHSFEHIFYGCLFGIPIGLFLATLSFLYPIFRFLTSWVISLLRPIPPIAWIPIVVGTFGIDLFSAVIIIAIGVVWTIYLTALSGFEAISYEYFELAEIFGRSDKFYLLVDIIYPTSAPALLSGIHTAIGQSITLVVAAELFGIKGVGQRMWEASGLIQMDVVVSYMLLIGSLYLCFDKLFNNIERRVFKWRKII